MNAGVHGRSAASAIRRLRATTSAGRTSLATSHSHSSARRDASSSMLRPGHGGSGASCNVRAAPPAAAHAADDAVEGWPRWPSAVPGRAASATTGRLAPKDLGGRERDHRHRLDLNICAGRISVDLQEHVADAQGRALAMGDDDLDLVHVGHSRGDDNRRHRAGATGDPFPEASPQEDSICMSAGRCALHGPPVGLLRGQGGAVGVRRRLWLTAFVGAVCIAGRCFRDSDPNVTWPRLVDRRPCQQGLHRELARESRDADRIRAAAPDRRYDRDSRRGHLRHVSRLGATACHEAPAALSVTSADASHLAHPVYVVEKEGKGY